MRHALIMAGGSGTRLWPLSRAKRPKQLLRLFDGRSLLQHARMRLAGLFEPQNIWVITSAAYLDLVANELPDLPRENLIGEPEGRDTANAIGLAAHLLTLRDADGTMAVFTADHIIAPENRFREAIATGLAAAESNPESLITFGVTPDSPHTGYGYIRRGESLTAGVHRVGEFREKPDAATAAAYLRSGEYLWNSGMFVWRTGAILKEMERQLPENHAALRDLAASWRTLSGTSAAALAFSKLKKISVDFGIMEKAASVLVVEMNCRWQDLGAWTAVAATRETDAAGNVVLAPQTLLVDSRDNVIVSESGHLLALIGVRDLIVVHSGDATLVCRKEDEQRLKEIVAARQAQFGSRFE
jgi:mannose-1-phosphate guanylyltransferase